MCKTSDATINAVVQKALAHRGGKGIEELTQGDQNQGQVKMLTSCPACQQGLTRYGDETGLKTDYIVVELARRLLGETWQDTFITKARAGGIEQVLL